MFSIKQSLGCWRSTNGDGKKYNDAQAAGILFREAEAFLAAVQRHLGLCQCGRCGEWGKLEVDLFVLRAGDKPVCGKMDCICNKFSGEDYTSDTIISVALLASRYKIHEIVLHAVEGIEPLIREVRMFVRAQEVPYEHYKADKKAIYKRFKEDFDQIDACATEPATPVEIAT